MEEKYKKFREFNWKENKDWQKFYSDLYPKPPQSKILKYKKIFYRKNIDPDFDIDYNPKNNGINAFSHSCKENKEDMDNDTKKEQESNQTLKKNFTIEQTFENYRIAQTLTRPIYSPLWRNIESFLMFFFVLTLPFRFKTIHISLIAFLIRCIRLTGIPRFEKSYYQALVMNDSFHNFVTCLLALTDRFNYYMTVPITLSVVIAVCDNFRNSNISINSIRNFVSTINKNKDDLLKDRSHIEVAIGFITIFGAIIRINSLITPVIYWQLMRVRYMINPYDKQSFILLNSLTNEFKDSPKRSSFLKFAIEIIQAIFRYMGKMNDPNENKEQKK